MVYPRFLLFLSYIIYISWVTVVEADLKALFSIASTLRCWWGRYFFPGIASPTFDPYLKLLSVKQSCIKYHFWVFNMTWDWTPVFQAIGEHSNHYSSGRIPCGLMVNMLDFDILANEFEPFLRYFVNIRTNTLWKIKNPC